MNRLTIVEMVYHESEATDGLVGTDHRYCRLLKSNDTWYQRPPFVVSEEPKAIDSGWVVDVGMMVIENREKLDSNRIVEVLMEGCEQPMWRILPGETMRGVPVDVKQLRLRCLQGTAIVACTLIPA
jgi:hypothetical protein